MSATYKLGINTSDDAVALVATAVMPILAEAPVVWPTGEAGDQLSQTIVMGYRTLDELKDYFQGGTSDEFLSTTAVATPSALSATQFTGFASTVSGATLMGYGTTGDVTLKNRAGTDALWVIAGTLGTGLAGPVVQTVAQPAAVGTTPGTAGTASSFTQGQGGNTTIATTGVGGKGAGWTVTTGAGGTAALAATAGTGGAGGDMALTTGAGAVSAVTGAGTGTGGKGGAIAFLTGVGGAASTSTGANVGGASGAITVTTAAGGAATNGSANTGGASGVITLATGNGGAGATAQGNSGSITLQTGTTTATVGTIIMAPGAATTATFNTTGVTMASTMKIQCAVSTTTRASINFGNAGTAPTSPADGDAWIESDTLKLRLNGSTVTVTTS